jgi:cytochrome c oxidase subunit 2
LLNQPDGMVSMRFLSLSLLALASSLLIGASRPAAQSPDPRVIEVTARRFAFEPAEIEATVGERLQLVVRSADGVHGLEIKKLKIKKEVPRGGEPVTIDFTATTEGSFPILCSEYCGNGHEEMTGVLVVRSVAGGTSGEPASRTGRP